MRAWTDNDRYRDWIYGAFNRFLRLHPVRDPLARPPMHVVEMRDDASHAGMKPEIPVNDPITCRALLDR